MCRNCTQEGHYTAECTNPRKLDLSHIVDRSQEEAWDLMTKANDAKDFDSFKQHMLEYLKASPGTKLDEIEKAMRTQGFNYWIYALV
ncbi:hypothetical protein L873DRAFT_1216256 [Choiromyces venosus 120613-1]|uniref:CCHC-type domain-containing protein n=1 Tax=Choiromyces venosus 120613-1 TaxID=1336337 RepID=A0A3N4JE52_9PEZI|nr:hypothetical protein L873DRAFT_1216256 [Choiromyces venosus 120613-1]